MSGPAFAAPESATVKRLSVPAQFVVCSAGLAGLIYFPWRLTTFNPHALTLSIALYGAELFGLLAIVLHAFMTLRWLERTSPPAPEKATVDVFIPTYNEPVSMLRRTVLAARDMRFPHITWLLDDGNRPAMADLAAELGVKYLARGDNLHAKAGNLNYALARSKGEFIAIFDADHVPHQDYLMKTLGYFGDKSVAFVQTPQDFYNLDSFQHRKHSVQPIVWTEQSLFFRVIMPGKDYWNAAFFCGSCATVRRAAVENIGGFATETVTEDIHTSIRLHKKGYRSVYHPESLAFGVAPATFEPYESQRVRWGQGAMQVWRKEGVLTARGLTLAQRLCYLASVLTYFDGWQKAFMYLLPSFVLATGILPVAALNWHFAMVFLPWWFLSLWACEELGRGYARSWVIEQYNFLRYPGFAFATLSFFFNRKLKFHVTQKGGSQRSENIRRLAPHFAVITLAGLATSAGVIRYAIKPYMQPSAFVLNLAWIGMVLSIATVAMVFALRRTKQERETYRFNLPVPMVVYWPNSRAQIAASDDVSSGGAQLRGTFSVPPAVGTRADVDLVLPEGRSRVSVDVTRSSPAADGLTQQIAMRFLWPSKNGADQLDRYLYGSNDQWLLNSLQERMLTPVEQLGRLFQTDRIRQAPIHDWEPAVAVLSDFSQSQTVLVLPAKTGQGVSALMSNRPLVSSRINLILPKERGRVASYQVLGFEAQEMAGLTAYIHKLQPRNLGKNEPAEWIRAADRVPTEAAV